MYSLMMLLDTAKRLKNFVTHEFSLVGVLLVKIFILIFLHISSIILTSLDLSYLVLRQLLLP